jgi:acyl-CoA reductase-like NAD-dependent aldehyde dehydrogenase
MITVESFFMTTNPSVPDISLQAREARSQLASWAKVPLRERLAIVRAFRHRLGERSRAIAKEAANPFRNSVAETMTAEVMPLAAACRFLEKEAASLLRPRKRGVAGSPFWLGAVRLTTYREPCGVILVIASSNYPLFLVGVQVMQAVVSGNAVLVKPGRDTTPVTEMLLRLLTECGLPKGLVQVLPETVEAAEAAIDVGVDKVFLTGSMASGSAVLGRLARTVTPSAMELSGCDAVFVREDAKLIIVAKALAFGLRFNKSATCIAPRRVYVPAALVPELKRHIVEEMRDLGPVEVAPRTWEFLRDNVTRSREQGAELVRGGVEPDHCINPIVLAGLKDGDPMLAADVFAPVLALIETDGDEDALEKSAACPYALGSSVFGQDRAAAARLGGKVEAGIVVVNDLIAATADPRTSFGGWKHSGFGSTRGPEGLLECTRVRNVVERRLLWWPHFDPIEDADADLVEAAVRVSHAPTLLGRWRGFCDLIAAARARTKRSKFQA